ncbi:MAG: hypothetical protein V1858_03355 [Candidatus Gottesmanbacteria bacterium]
MIDWLTGASAFCEAGKILMYIYFGLFLISHFLIISLVLFKNRKYLKNSDKKIKLNDSIFVLAMAFVMLPIYFIAWLSFYNSFSVIFSILGPTGFFIGFLFSNIINSF